MIEAMRCDRLSAGWMGLPRRLCLRWAAIPRPGEPLLPDVGHAIGR